jgi:dihydroneopterin aldolase
MSNKYKNISIISTGSWVPSDLSNPENKRKRYKVQIKKLILNAFIGIHEHERLKKQRVSVSLSLEVVDNLSQINENIKNVVSYEQIILNLKKLVSKGHIELLETLGERISVMCFKDAKVLSVWIKLEKLDVFSDTDSVGIEIFKEKTDFLGKKSNSLSVTNIKEK